MNDQNVLTTPENIESLKAWAEKIESEIAEITSTIVPLQKKLEAAREKYDLVQRLIHLSSPTLVSSYGDADIPHSTQQTLIAMGIENHIEDILRSNGKPMHISEIRTSLIQNGIPLPGRGDEANIILRLRRAVNLFVRTDRGIYALKEWKIPEYSPKSNKKINSRQRRK